MTTKTKDTERRELIVAQAHPTPRAAHGLYLDLRISLLPNGVGFIRAKDGGALDLSSSNDDVLLKELTELVALLRYAQMTKEAEAAQ